MRGSVALRGAAPEEKDDEGAVEAKAALPKLKLAAAAAGAGGATALGCDGAGLAAATAAGAGAGLLAGAAGAVESNAAILAVRARACRT